MQSETLLPAYEAKYPDWRNWWLVARFKEAFPHDIPTPGHIQAMAAIVEGLGAPWNISTKWERCKWYHRSKGAISFAYYSDLATFDRDGLTRLVLAAHKHCVRVEVEPCNMQAIRLTFWPRDPEGARRYERHPTLSELAVLANAGGTADAE